ncbi:hypothetical protein CI610_03212 [invertebrate metagenome]|uniref:Uncharacterized protein n=1 Tax=invertebrate metagenome TaxID=1711999 RepID=A0A2H9T3T2_9ZZZZ
MKECVEKNILSSKGILYQHVYNSYSLQNYLKKSISVEYLREITKIRLSSHTLNIEKGRYHNIERHQRVCHLCDMNDIEDEFLFV